MQVIFGILIFGFVFIGLAKVCNGLITRFVFWLLGLLLLGFLLFYALILLTGVLAEIFRFFGWIDF